MLIEAACARVCRSERHLPVCAEKPATQMHLPCADSREKAGHSLAAGVVGMDSRLRLNVLGTRKLLESVLMDESDGSS